MSSDWRLRVEPWQLREVGVDLTRLGRTESLFALSNGHLGVRGNLDEGEPGDLPGSYLNGLYEAYPLSYAETAFGDPDCGELMINATNGKLIKLLVDDEPFDVRTGQLLSSERTLDFRAGTLRRSLRWRSPAGQVVSIVSTRLVSFTQRSVLAIDYVVEAMERDVRLLVQSELLANEEVDEPSGNEALRGVVAQPLSAEDQHVTGDRAFLVHRTADSGLRLAAAVEHRVDGAFEVETSVEPDCARTTVTAVLRPDERLRVTKFICYEWSPSSSVAALRDQTDAGLSRALASGWDGLVAEQRRFLDDFWNCADVRVEGDPEVQQGVRFGLFHLLQASARAEGHPIPAKGLTGTGYLGHAFWETEMFVLPVLTALLPSAAADALAWRHSTLPLARARATQLGYHGATLPWRTISGRECGAYWPAGTAAFHVNADVAAAASAYVRWTADQDFERTYGLDLLVETARLWMSLGYLGSDGRFHIDGVTGPDEYSALVDDNTYTNVMAAHNLSEAARVVRRWPADAARCNVSESEIMSWSSAAKTMAIPYDEALSMPQQFRDSTKRQCWDFEATAEIGGYPLQKHYPYVEIYRKQVVKQSDLMLAMHWQGDRFPTEQRSRAFSHYEKITVRDSSLSASTQAVLAADLGHLDLAHAYVREAALMDLDDLEHDTDDGLHMASLAGGWIGLVCGFGGLRDHGGQLRMAPRLPRTISRLEFAVRWRGRTIRVAISAAEVEYRLMGSDPKCGRAPDAPDSAVELVHCGRSVALYPDCPVRMDLPEYLPATEAPQQPAGRSPRAGSSQHRTSGDAFGTD